MSALLRTARRFTPSLLDIGLPACSQRQLSWWSGKKKVEPVAVKPDDKKDTGDKSETERMAERMAATMGIYAQELATRVTQDAELMALIAKPELRAIMADMQRNPASAFKHMNNPDVQKFMRRISEIVPALKK